MKVLNGPETNRAKADLAPGGPAGSGGSPPPAMALGSGPPAGDHRKLALVRLSMLGGMLVVLPLLLLGLGYSTLAVPVAVGLLVLLAATGVGYLMGLRADDLRGSWLFYAVADTVVVLVLSLIAGPFLNIFLLAVIVELARIYRHGRLVIIGSVIIAGIVLLEQGLVMLAPGLLGPLAHPVVAPDGQGLLLTVTIATVAVIVGRSLSTFIQHYAREIFSYERIQAMNAAELHVAHEIQSSLMAPRDLESGPWVIAALSIPAKEVGGDFYEYVPALGNSIGGIAVGDVSGKGIPAALQMAVVRTIFRIEARRRIFPAETLTRVNQALQTEMPTGMVTLLYAFVDPIEGVMHYANAGHNYPVVISDHVEELKLSGLPLGVDGDVEYEERQAVVEPGTSIVFYTDGVVEAENGQGEIFSFERLFALLQHYRALPPKELVHRIIEEVQAFTGPTPQTDDITVVVLHHALALNAERGVSRASRHVDARASARRAAHVAIDPAPAPLARQVLNPTWDATRSPGQPSAAQPAVRRLPAAAHDPQSVMQEGGSGQ